MYGHTRFPLILLILLLGLAPLAASCSPFGGDEDDEPDEEETPTAAIVSTPEAEESPEAEDTPESGVDETASPEAQDTTPGPAPGGETPEATPEDEPDATPEDTADATPEADLLAQGAQIFANVCAACHQPDGQGIEGIYPALAGNQFVTLEDPQPVIQVVLTGRGGMPRFADSYNNEQIAGIISYIRSDLGNNASEVEPSTVQEVRDMIQDAPEDEDRTGGEQTDDSD